METEQSSTQPVTTSPKRGADVWRFTAELVQTFLIVTVLAYAIRLFVLQPFIVEGSSMVPRFENKDYLLVDKVSYRLHTPGRGDIIVFKYPLEPSVNYVKRVIGLPGEKVRIADGKVKIFNKAHAEGFYIEEPYVNNNAQTNEPNNEPKEFTMGDTEYFVLGDNRPASSDSRIWGVLPKDDIIGRVIIQAYPLNRIHLVPHAAY